MRCLPTQILVHKHFSISLCSSFAISYSYKQINWPLAMIVLEPNFFRLSAKMCTFFRARASNQMVSKSQTSLLYPHRYEVGKVVTKDTIDVKRALNPIKYLLTGSLGTGSLIKLKLVNYHLLVCWSSQNISSNSRKLKLSWKIFLGSPTLERSDLQFINEPIS